MKITIGEWKTRGGRKAIVAAENKEALSEVQLIGWIEGFGRSWNSAGRRDSLQLTPDDLISPWTDPVPWDWSTTPPWFVCLVKGPHDGWYLSEGDVDTSGSAIGFGSLGYYAIPRRYYPQWSGDWKLSKTMRPGYKESK